ncbi:MAG: lipopolysaccharide assembly protein LapA domain-containing protein [Pseudomonas sp.]|uniref:lipopolysaccharide assembly protein LapA domain-containing protein n=1 Tax=Pseudomonas sp. TaxID=306 RepID=UPI003C723F67
MRGVKRVVLVLTVLAVALVVLGFVLENQQQVSLSFLGWTTAQLPASVLMVLFLIAGMAIGPVFAVLLRGSSRRSLKSQAR